MKWIEIQITTTQQAQEAISELLIEKGAKGTEIVDPYAFKDVLKINEYLDYADDGLVESYGSDVIVKAWFSEDCDMDKLESDIENSLIRLKSFLDTGAGVIVVRLRDDSEWKDNWKQYFKPFKFTNKIVIKPSWENYNSNSDELVIELDPGMAFGTGTHETTKMCAMLGEKYIKQNDKVLDLGCGTAILAISSIKLGAASALAVDIDTQAIKTAKENVLRNNVEGRVTLKQGELKDIKKEKYDLIFINIIADIILELTQSVKAYTGTGTRLLLSGIIKTRRDEILEAYTSVGFKLLEEMEQGDWVAMAFNA
ncbi:MAG: 50S ribosomal protein L11 methyltransferase [Clostridiaceae bacterium]|nr:50S ribosomal protein L11 methyltransferase [Clostridiaceae bacterium]